MKKILPFIALSLIVVLGFWFRLKGISNNHSFWADESTISILAKDILTKKLPFIEGTMKVFYEPLQIAITTIFLKVFGISEFSARLPSVLFGTIGIIFAYLVAAKLSTPSGGLLAAFLYAFSQINLANSTQAKPYASLQTLFLISIYLLFLLIQRQKKAFLYHLLIIVTLTIATLIHLIGVFLWIPYLFLLTLKIKNKWLIPIGLVIFIFVFRLWPSIMYLFKPVNGRMFLVYNNMTYLRELLWKNYGFIFLPAVFGIFITWKKNEVLLSGIILWLIALLFFWNFRSYSHNIRYLIPLFGVMFVFFAVFWSKVGSGLLHNQSLFTCLAVIVLLYIGGNKISRKPSPYYSPNTDLYGDVQIADYKATYKLIEKKFPNYAKLAIFNDFDSGQSWYLNEPPTLYFRKGFGNEKPEKDPLDGKVVYKNLDQFIREKNKFSKGLLVIEDWESFLPEDIKQYAKKNMKLEIKVNGLSQAKDDPWPLEVYSWGL